MIGKPSGSGGLREIGRSGGVRVTGFWRDQEGADEFYGVAEPEPGKGQGTRIVPYILAGITLIGGVAFIGHYLGQNASARGAPGSEWSEVVEQPTTIIRKASLLHSSDPLETTRDVPMIAEQAVIEQFRTDLRTTMISLPSAESRLEAGESVIYSPAVAKLNDMFERGQETRKQVVAARKRRAAEESCLARAIYFEARSESELGQKAVAKVIMNRVKDPEYPSTVCGVVFQNQDKLNACQFSFACDGKPDRPKAGPAWTKARALASEALDGQLSVANMDGVLNYHADYVQPRWARFMKRVVKIGRHIFYNDS